MKKIITALTLVAVFAACKQNRSEPEKVRIVLVQDTSMLYNNSVLTDKAGDGQTYAASAGTALAAVPPVVPKIRHRTNTSVSSSSNSTASNDAVASNTVPAKKKGLSHKVKGTLVGAGTGAITGAIINKNNRGVGAIVGALAGAASGYIIGNEVDKKVEKKKRP